MYMHVIEKLIEKSPDYTIDNFGVVRNTFGKSIIPAQMDGYKMIWLITDGKSKKFRVHRLVAEAFIPNPDNKPEVNHIDGNRTNNTVTNLEWVTSKENTDHYISLVESRVLSQVIRVINSLPEDYPITKLPEILELMK